ncbi:hypothetical protein H2248_012209 [Termitomyces sp. 'cryptogamus']|nr:hypothetical protein H2248_012209 [Termitomyces sp. 'cryptogamus']
MFLSGDDHKTGEIRLQEIRRQSVLGQFTASALAGNAVFGSVFYALPAVVAVSTVYSPISLIIATFVLFLWRPIMEELGSALPMSGAPYTYILNVSSKSFALIGATLLLLDYIATSMISAATAASYLVGEVKLPIPELGFAVLVLAVLTLISLLGVRESARIALFILTFHMGSMMVLVVSSLLHLGTTGSQQLRDNWNSRSPSSPSSIWQQVFYGICLGMLGLTGFECTPSYIGRIKEGHYPLVLRNLHLPAIALNGTIMVLVLANVPLETVLGGANVLSVLAQTTAGRWLRIWIVIDATVVLCGGVLTGILSACELLEQLAFHRILPEFFCLKLPITESPYVSVFSFVAFCGMLYASAGASLSMVSQMFSLVWLTVMSLFPLALLLLKLDRGRIARTPNTHVLIVFSSIVISILVFAGNIALNPATAGYFLVYFLSITTIFKATQNRIHLLRWVYWLCDEHPCLHSLMLIKIAKVKLIDLMLSLKSQPICILVKTSEFNQLVKMISYVRNSEETSCIKIVHFNDCERGIIPVLEAHAKILREDFPEFLIDLIIVDATFNPPGVMALSNRLNIPTPLMFMSCPGARFPFSIADFGTRIISL